MLLAALLPAGAHAAETFVKDLASAGGVVVNATAVHPVDGSMYVVGTFAGDALTIGARTLSLVGGQSTGFIAKMGSDGGWRWAGTLADTDGRGSLVPRALAVTANNVYLCGDATNGVSVVVQNGTATFPGELVRTNVSRAPFVLKLDTEGRTIWAQMAANSEAATGGSAAYGYDLAVDGVGSVFVCGSFRSDKITNDTTQGLNFGAHHAFRIRDTSGTSGSTDWSYLTRDGFVAKLDGAGNWRWVATGGGLEDLEGGFFSIAVDAVSTVYVTGNAKNGRGCFGGALINAGCTAEKWHADRLGGAASFGPDVPTDNTVAYVARLGGSGSATDGRWLGDGFALATGSKVGSGCQTWGSIETRARNVVWVNNQVFAAYYNQDATDLHIARLTQDLSAVEATAVVSGNAVNDMSPGVSLAANAAGVLHLTGWFGFPGADFTHGSAGEIALGTSLPQCPFIARLSPTLEWQWVSAANTPEIPTALPAFGTMASAVDSQSGRFFVAGSFANGILDIGPSTSNTVLPPAGVQGANPRSFVATLLPSGEFLEQVTFELLTDHGADLAQPPQTPQTLLKGTTVVAAVPPLLYEDAAGNSIDPADSGAIEGRAVVRHTCIGFEVPGTAITGQTAGYTFTIGADTQVRFKWRTEYALEIRNDLSGSRGGLTSTAAGNPDPVVQKHWIEAGTITTTFIDGVIPSPNPNEFGTRYRSTGYVASGAASGFNRAIQLGPQPGGGFAYAVASDLDLAGRSFTVEGWVKTDLDHGYVFAYGTGDPAEWALGIGAAGEFSLIHGYSGPAGWQFPPPRPADGEWHHCAVVLDHQAQVAHFYLDGELAGTYPGPRALTTARGTFYMGNWPSGCCPLNGGLDEVRVWGTARSAEEIRAFKDHPATGAEAGLLAAWNFDEASGPVFANLTAAGPAAFLVSGDAAALRTAGVDVFIPWPGVQARQQVPQFLMSGPSVIEYRWIKENRIQVGVAAPALAASPLTVSGSLTNLGTGEFWFEDGAPVRISAPETASAGGESYQIKGFLGGTGNVTPVTGGGARGDGFRYYDIPTLTQGSSITWDYSDRIYKGRVVIGEAIDFAADGTFTGKEAIPESDGLNPANAPLSTVIVADVPPGSSIEDMRVWDDVADKLYPLRPGVILLEWGRRPGSPSSRSIFTEITVEWPDDPGFTHVANTPPVPLDTNKTNTVAFVGLKYAERSGRVTDTAEFTAGEAGWSVLLFSERTDGTAANGDLTREQLRVRTVRSRNWSEGLLTEDALIGAPLASPLHAAAVPHNGYVYFEKARYNPAVHDRLARSGPIIPVNREFTAAADDDLVVVWYQVREEIAWPYQAVRYDAQWPDTDQRIVIASRLGSEGLTGALAPQPVFTSDRFEQVSVYQQPDPAQPGYNPNEEHALIRPSLRFGQDAAPPPAAFALRNNLNVTNRTEAYTSDPYVLLQYYDRQAGGFAMSVYRVEVADPALPARRLEFTAGATVGGASLALGAGNRLEFTFNAHGLMADEVVELEQNGSLTGVASGRFFALPLAANRFALAREPGGDAVLADGIEAGAPDPRVVVARTFPYTFDYAMRAGEPVIAPYPLAEVIGATPCDPTSGLDADPGRRVYWEDHKRQAWAVSGDTDPAEDLRMFFHYPLDPSFWHPNLGPGECVPYIGPATPQPVNYNVTWPLVVPGLKAGETLTFSGGENQRDNPGAPGLPGVLAWAAGQIVYDDANPALDPARTTTAFLGRLASPLSALTVPLSLGRVPAALQPAGGEVTVRDGYWVFTALDASLQPRLFYDPLNQELGVRGLLDGKTLGDPTLTAAPGSVSVLQPNILTARDREALRALDASPDWRAAVDALVTLSRDPLHATNGEYGVGLEAVSGQTGRARPAVQFGPGLALLPNPALLDPGAGLSEGYLTLAENNDPSLGAAPVALHVLRMQKQPLLRGAIRTILPSNPFDEKITLRHSGDFGANADELVFEWSYRPDDGQVFPPPDQTPGGVWTLFGDPSGNNGRGMLEINLAGAGAVTLSDNRFFVRWRHADNPGVWSAWAGAANSRPPAAGEQPQDTYVPQLAEGWVKRVLGGINPFDARIQDFRNNNTPATYASMVQQAGAPYRGPVALNADAGVVENVGLIELYTTVLERARTLSIDLTTPVSTPAVNNAILLAASRLADLYLLLGNEAFSDAQDPTIGFGTESIEYGTLAPTIFCFQNQAPSLLEEELALLRGRGAEGAYPAYNRLLWNFTRAEGEAAYALSYNVTDQNSDGFINEADGRIMYPQGHGDAWGHYLSALKTYYDLLRHPAYNWQTRAETLAIDGVVVDVDYLDERKFAQAAAARARTGAELVNLTYRSRYVEDPDGQWQGYQDTDPGRAWGVSEWARRAGCAALYDWVTANALLPAEDPGHTGIQRVDRTTVGELAEVAAQARDIRRHLDDANAGLNPLGLATDVVPFDIDPSFLDTGSVIQGQSHFDQVYLRAMKALNNALDLFNNANDLNRMLRQGQQTADQFAADAVAADLDFRNRLIEVFGTPYEGTIGAGKAYPAGYNGPDLYLYMYVDVTGVSSDTVPPPSASFTAFFEPFDQGLVKLSEGGTDTITSAFSHYFNADVNLAGVASTDFSGYLELNLPQTAAGYSFQAPTDWGQRRAPGELQQVLSEMVQAQADVDLAIADYAGNLAAIQDVVNLVRAQSDLGAETIRLLEKGRDTAIGLDTAIFTAESVAASFNLSADQANQQGDVAADALPKVVGLASDAFATIRSVIKGGTAVAATSLKSTAMVAERSAAFLEGTKEITQLQQDIDIEKAGFRYAVQEQLAELNGLLGNEAPLRVEVFRRQEALRQISDKYRGLLASGLRLLEERALHNRRSAGATQENRYQDFTFRVARNEALAKYRAAFDLAARYAYLAAKAYDYETNLDPYDPASAVPLLTQIIRSRTLGVVENEEPRIGSGGLADVLATLHVNFAVLRTQMGIDNPQGESGQFSLRHELFRLRADSDARWREELEHHRVADLWQVPEFRRYCRPFAPQDAGAQPGLVIPFSTRIVFGENFFGWPLGPGDSAYDPTLFATKIARVGVWFDDYAGEGLGTTPRVYLVPAGLDIMYVPGSADLATREWNVVDQRIPTPLPVGQTALNDPDWIPLHDSLNGVLAEIRRYSSFRAFHNAGFSEDEMTLDSRLIGRSVWNTRWLLIIPGGTFLADQTEGLDTFIYGLRATDGAAIDSRGNPRDGHGISDIKLSFQTYAISGN
ncbi:MAG: LamG domain-containing protein [Verrucomicrobiales bacterium]|nr:LamG domain-containing protein [Verrucomicrobiales bacterium]